MKILLTGGTGFIGKSLAKKLIDKGYEVNILSRQKDFSFSIKIFSWDIIKNKIDSRALNNIDGIIHLAGAPISKRWTRTYKEKIISSRVQSAQLLLDSCKQKNIKLNFFISASGINYYGTTQNEKVFKEDNVPGNDFLAQVCEKWEAIAHQFSEISTNVCILRTGVVLDKEGGTLQQLLPIYKLNLGSILGTGNQYMPWISLEDLLNMYLFTIEKKINGIYNAVYPEIITNKYFTQTLAKTLHKFYLPIPIPTPIVKMLLGEMSTIVLNGNKISSDKIIEEGFQFKSINLQTFLINNLK